MHKSHVGNRKRTNIGRISKVSLKKGENTVKQSTKEKIKSFWLDLNVSMSNMYAMFGFTKHNVRLTKLFLEEIDKNKVLQTSRGYNARGTISLLLHLAESVPMDKLHQGVRLVMPNERKEDCKRGKLFFTLPKADEVRSYLNTSIPDHRMLLEFLDGTKSQDDSILVSNDKMVRLWARLLGITAQDYRNDAIETRNLYATGVHEISAKIWDSQSKDFAPVREGDRIVYRLTGHQLTDTRKYEFLRIEEFEDSGTYLDLMVMEKPSSQKVTAVVVKDHMKHYTYGINALNFQQKFAMEAMLMGGKGMKAVVVHGETGSGKNLLALAVAHHLIFVERLFDELIVVRDMIPVEGEKDTGYLPGSLTEKVIPWVRGFTDNMQFLAERAEKFASEHQLTEKLPIRYETYATLRGASLHRKVFIMDEAQNTRRETLKMAFERLADDSFAICLGSLSQKDRVVQDRSTMGFQHLISIMPDHPMGTHIYLLKNERGVSSNYFSNNM